MTRPLLLVSFAAALLGSAGGVIALAPATPANAATNPVLSNVVPEPAIAELVVKIRSIDPASRRIVAVTSTGETLDVIAGPVVRLNLLKAGDLVRMRYYRSVAFAISAPQSAGTTARPDASEKTGMLRPADAPGGISVRLTKLRALVVGIDQAARRIDVVPPSGGGVYTIEITDPARAAKLSQVKVGETITATVSEALAVQIERAPAAAFPASGLGGGTGAGAGRGGR